LHNARQETRHVGRRQPGRQGQQRHAPGRWRQRHLIKDLKVKGTSVTLKRGQMCRNIRLTDDADLVECNVDKVKGLVLRTEFLKKA
jgi:protein PhnA